jgi:deazaflavin-dependent oxidoreductase (nitroreductase family)
MQGRDVLLLTTIGNKSGKERTVPVVPFVEGGKTYVIASNGGAPRPPAWYINLRANPDVRVQLGADTWRARAVPVDGEERDRLWKNIVEQMPNFGKYQEKTTRIIPLVKLEKTP